MRAAKARTVRGVMAAMTVGAFGAAAVLFGAGVAKADPVDNYARATAPAICATLDDFPTFNGITGIGQGIVEDTGFSYYQAGEIVGTAVYVYCPRHIPLMQRFVATFAPGGGSVGTVMR